MKILALALILPLLITIDSPKEVENSKVDDDTATLVFFRKGQLAGAAKNFNIYVNGEKLCKISNNRFFSYDVAAGETYFTSKAGGAEFFKKKEVFSLNTEAGKTYYIECALKASITRARLEFSEVTENTAKNKMKKMKEDNCQTKIED